jgi:CRISPR-associated protein Cas5d
LAVQVEVWGEYALFSAPEFSTERLSYDVITPSAARGILEAVFFHPGMRFVIDRIHVLNPIEFASIRRNEVSDKISAPKMVALPYRKQQ